MSEKFLIENHNKTDHEIYSLVERLCAIVLQEIPEISGLIFGGSYAKGEYVNGDDVDVDILFDNYPPNQSIIRQKIMSIFLGENLKIDIRVPLAKSAINESLRKQTYMLRSNLPIATRSREVANDWGLSSE